MPASPDPDLALRLAKATVDLYSAAVERLLAHVARRLAAGLDQPGWAERKLLEVDALRRQAQVEVERLTAEVGATIEEAVTEAFDRGAAEVARDLARLPPSPGGPSPLPVATNPALIDALAAETVGQVTATHPQILRSTVDAFRDVIAETAAPDVLAGTRTRRQAAQQALDRFATRGITGFVDSAGRRWALESYTEMAVRTAVGRAQVAGALDRFEGQGRDLVIVSDAPQECPACRRFEGKVLSISGATPAGTRVTGGDGATFTVVGTVASATRAGLWHPNCRHRAGAFVEGLTDRMTDTADPEGDRARQEQRRLERGVRQWKRREAAALTDEDRARARRHRQDWTTRLGEHVDGHDGLRRRRDHEGVGRRAR